MSSSGISPGAGGKDPLIGSVLSERYRLDRLLGEGGMGKVYAAEHILMRKKLAIKILHAELCGVPEVIARFEREAMATANIDHPNIAAATDFGKLPDGSVFLVLEFVEGKSLRDEIAAGAMPVERALHITRQIAEALAAAHALNIVHRDLKPENVMLVSRGADPDFVKVLDFGVAKVPPGGAAGGPLSAGPLTKAGMVFGTPEYMAPEQALGQPVDGRADLYGLGVMAFEMLSGVRPFSSTGDVGILGQQLSKPAPAIAEAAPGVRVPHQAEQVVMKLLAKETSARYQSAEQVVQALDELLRPPPGKGAQRFTLTGGSQTAILGSASQVLDSAAARMPAGPKAQPPRPAAPRPDVTAPTMVAGSLENKPPIVPEVGKPTFLPSDPLPSFTFPSIDPDKVPPPPKTIGGAPDAKTAAASSSSVEAVVNKPAFLPNEPLPAFTFPVLEEEKVQELAQRVAAARAGKTAAVPPLAPPLPPLGAPGSEVGVGPGAVPAAFGSATTDPAGSPLGAPPAPAARSFGARTQELVARLRRNELVAQGLQATGRAWRRGVELGRQWIATACRAIDASRSRLPERLRHALRNVRAGVILAVLAGIAWGALLLFMLVLVGSSRSDADNSGSGARTEAAAPQNAIPEDPVLREIDEAKKRGHDALAKLAEQHPKHARVWVELAGSHAAKSDYVAAVAAIGKALDADAKASEEVLAGNVLQAAVRQRDTSSAALSLLEERMGAPGAAILYDLSIDPKARPSARTRAQTWVRSDRFKKVAAPDVEIAGALRYSRSCSDKHSLLPRAAELGAERALDYLKIAKVRGGCGRGGRTDCFPCLRKDDALKDAIAAIEKRLAANK